MDKVGRRVTLEKYKVCVGNGSVIISGDRKNFNSRDNLLFDYKCYNEAFHDG